MPVTEYKKAEKEVADRLGVALRRGWLTILAFFRLIVQKGRQRFTVMLIPHSEKKIFNFQISFFTLVFVSFTQVVLLVGFIVLATHFNGTNERYTQASTQLKENESLLTGFKDEIATIRPLDKKFRSQMDELLKLIGLSAYTESGTGGPVITSTDIPAGEAAEGLQELSDLRGIGSQISGALQPMDEIIKVLTTYKAFVVDTPILWPLKGPYGNVTTNFGWETQPITGQGQLHTGLDIAWSVGVAIVATANGTVTQSGWSEDLGNFVQISHKFGFQTRYGHLSARVVTAGQHVNRGDVIGYLGNTGRMTTGPHLHYEVRRGEDYVDPKEFLLLMPESGGVKRQ